MEHGERRSARQRFGPARSSETFANLRKGSSLCGIDLGCWTVKIDGKCHCGGFTYQADIDPDQVYICNCNDCQSISGSAFRWAVPVAEEDFTLLSGDPKTYVKTADSGAASHQLFCPDCASPLYSVSITAGPRFFNLRLGTARQRDELRPRTQYWCRSAQGWLRDLDRMEKLDTQ